MHVYILERKKCQKKKQKKKENTYMHTHCLKSNFLFFI